MKSRYTPLIKQEALRLGFEECRIAKAVFLDEEAPLLEKWLKVGFQGNMKYMENHFDKRLDPRKLVEGAKSVISFSLNYFPEEEIKADEGPKISRYAYGKDYHLVIKEKLKQLLQFIRENIGEVNGRGFVDSAPLMDKAWARRSGLGWMGKHTNVIRQGRGSYFFIAELIVDIELEYDLPVADHCGTCTRCMDACPTGAIVEPYMLDGSRCISYFTIELKESIPDEMKGKFADWIFGCDICQEVCPWNSFATPHKEPGFTPDEANVRMSYSDWEEITEDIFRKRFKDTPLERPGYKGIKRNLNFLKSTRGWE